MRRAGVEGEIGRFRRNHLVPAVESLAEFNAMIDEWDAVDDGRRIGSRPHTVGEHFAIEQPLLAGLPDEPFETGRLFTPRVDRYSVPVRLIGRLVRVLLHASELVVVDGRQEIARLQRLTGRLEAHLELDHDLEALVRKPGAAPEQARAAGTFTPVHDAWWAAVRKARGDAAGTRTLIEVVLLHRSMANTWSPGSPPHWPPARSPRTRSRSKPQSRPRRHRTRRHRC
jgi:Mu transposase-like protein